MTQLLTNQSVTTFIKQTNRNPNRTAPKLTSPSSGKHLSSLQPKPKDLRPLHQHPRANSKRQSVTAAFSPSLLTSTTHAHHLSLPQITARKPSKPSLFPFLSQATTKQQRTSAAGLHNTFVPLPQPSLLPSNQLISVSALLINSNFKLNFKL